MTTSQLMRNRHVIAVTARAHGLPHPWNTGSIPQGMKANTTRNRSHLHQIGQVGCTRGLEVHYASFSSHTTDLFVLQNLLGSGSMLFSKPPVYLSANACCSCFWPLESQYCMSLASWSLAIAVLLWPLLNLSMLSYPPVFVSRMKFIAQIWMIRECS